jgi:hypothetical protein
MKRISFFVVVAGFVLISALVARTAMTDGPNADAAAAKAKITELRKQRIAALERVVECGKTQYKSGAGNCATLPNLGKVEEDLIKAKLDATDNPQERIELLKERLAIATRTFEFIEGQIKTGFQASDFDLERARAHRLKVEIKLQKELAKQ